MDTFSTLIRFKVLGTANAYVTGNGAVNGMVKIVVPTNAPNTLYYNCEFHGMMTGTITITN
jgi:hypothetical protein